MSVIVTNRPPVTLSVLPTALKIRFVVPEGTAFSPAMVIVPGPVFVTVFVPSNTAHAPLRARVRFVSVSIVKLRLVVSPQSAV
jgi:hypothetical protein